MRVTDVIEWDADQVRRFIPARAGNGDRLPSHSYVHPVHPRACGERHGFDETGESYAGSSPRVRGTVPAAEIPAGDDRFIPARAGNGIPRGHQSIRVRFIPARAGNGSREVLS